jgi:hypothetical protein
MTQVVGAGNFNNASAVAVFYCAVIFTSQKAATIYHTQGHVGIDQAKVDYLSRRTGLAKQTEEIPNREPLDRMVLAVETPCECLHMITNRITDISRGNQNISRKDEVPVPIVAILGEAFETVSIGYLVGVVRISAAGPKSFRTDIVKAADSN